jgi:hypothetical protein
MIDHSIHSARIGRRYVRDTHLSLKIHGIADSIDGKPMQRGPLSGLFAGLSGSNYRHVSDIPRLSSSLRLLQST